MPDTATRSAPAVSHKEIPPFTIELADDKNRRFDWPPVAQELRGRWMWSQIQGHSGEQYTEFMKIGDLPGICIEVDASKRRARVFDPLSLPVNRQRLAEASAAYERVMHVKPEPMEEQKYADLSPTDLKTWLYWSWRFVICRKAIEISGQVPDLDKIEALSGKTRINQRSIGLPQFREDPPLQDVLAKLQLAQ